MADIPDIKIDELDTTSNLDNAKDLLVAVHYSTAYSDNRKTVNFHPNTLMAYDNKKSHLNARTYQDAIDEIVSLMTVGQTFNVPLSPNPNANEIQVHTANLPTGE